MNQLPTAGYGWGRGVVAVVVLAATLFVAVRPVGPLPPVGPLLDPAHGVWSVARAAHLPDSFSANLPTLRDPVRVVYDRRGVPHIWANSVDDAMRALGYVVARDRLFQLELQTRAVAGRLTELVGPRALAADREQRALGLAWAAERAYAALDSQSAAARATAAYAEGVNAWISGMRPRDLPFEYHLIDARPQPWEPVYSAYLLKRMGYTLTYDRHELWRREVEALIGRAATAALFPANNPIQEPIQPNGRRSPRLDFREPPPANLRREAQPTAASRNGADPLPGGRPSLAWLDALGAPAPGIGSNNWAVSPARSASGYALLAGDPHLDLTLPSIWYEVHLVVPGEMDAYGVTIPGSPGIIIGFNRDIAWSMTNTGADVLDFYWETLDDPERPTAYSVEGEWRALEHRIEEYRDRHGEVIVADTISFTHRGPVLETEDGPLSIQWTVLEETGATEALLDGSMAGSVPAWLAATETFLAPAQNMIVADREGNIAIRATGRYPLRPDGWRIRDGGSNASGWSGEWPVARYPFALNPAQGFLASANQQPTDPAVDTAYLGVNWPSPWRAIRINQLLRADSQVTPDAMRRYQTDPGNARADWFAPLFIDAAERALEAESDPDLEEGARLLRDWDRRYTKENQRAVLFEMAMEELADRTWDELAPRGDRRRLATPGSAVLAQLTAFPENAWWDRLNTPDRVETRDDIFVESLRAALVTAKAVHGQPSGGGWRWDRVRHANVWHLAGFEALSALRLPVQGGSGNLNPSSGSGRHGASWRMVVELGPEIRAWATYPGGQSGNPASPWYDDRIPQWVAGVLDDVLFPRGPADLGGDDVAGVLRLEPASSR